MYIIVTNIISIPGPVVILYKVNVIYFYLIYVNSKLALKCPVYMACSKGTAASCIGRLHAASHRIKRLEIGRPPADQNHPEACVAAQK